MSKTTLLIVVAIALAAGGIYLAKSKSDKAAPDAAAVGTTVPAPDAPVTPSSDVAPVEPAPSEAAPVDVPAEAPVAEETAPTEVAPAPEAPVETPAAPTEGQQQ